MYEVTHHDLSAAAIIGADVCAQCGQPGAKKRCSQCKLVFYCSIDCQRAAWPKHKAACNNLAAAGKTKAATAPPTPPPPPPPRSGEGPWEDISEKQVMLALSDAEEKQFAAARAASTSLLAALAYGIRAQRVRVLANAPLYDRLVVWTTRSEGGLPGSGTACVEAGLDLWEGTGCWTTTDWSEADLASQGLVALDAAGLEAEYSGVLAFLEAAKRLGAPRYTLKTTLDPSAQPHVIRVVEKVLAGSPLRFLLSEDALERADVGP